MNQFSKILLSLPGKKLLLLVGTSYSTRNVDYSAKKLRREELS